MRDLAADMEICEKATPGPWEVSEEEMGHVIRMATALDDPGEYEPQHFIEYSHCLLYGDGKAQEKQLAEAKANAEFIAAAREGWPEAIQRAMEAEKEIKNITAHANLVRTKYNLSPDVGFEDLARYLVGERKQSQQMFEALQGLVALLDSDGPVVVGCHCTDTGDALLTCAWCQAKQALNAKEA